MSGNLNAYLKQIISPQITSHKDYDRILIRLDNEKLTRIENTVSHFCSMIIAFDPETQNVLLVHHKKAGSWIFPGGHIEKDELPIDTLIREAEEEIGLHLSEKEVVGPFSVQVLDIYNPSHKCREHYDMFFAAAVSQKNVTINMDEFLGYKWLSIDQAKQQIELKYYRDALDKFVKFIYL